MDTYTGGDDTMAASESNFAYQDSAPSVDYTTDSGDPSPRRNSSFFRRLEHSVDGDATDTTTNPPPDTDTDTAAASTVHHPAARQQPPHDTVDTILAASSSATAAPPDADAGAPSAHHQGATDHDRISQLERQVQMFQAALARAEWERDQLRQQHVAPTTTTQPPQNPALTTHPSPNVMVASPAPAAAFDDSVITTSTPATSAFIDGGATPLQPATAGPSGSPPLLAPSPTPARHVPSGARGSAPAPAPAPLSAQVAPAPAPAAPSAPAVSNDDDRQRLQRRVDSRRENADLRRENADLRREVADLRRENADLRREVGDGSTAITAAQLPQWLQREYRERRLDKFDRWSKVQLANCLKITVLELLHCRDVDEYEAGTRVAAKNFRVMHAFCESLYHASFPRHQQWLVDMIVAGDVVAFTAAIQRLATKFNLTTFNEYLGQSHD